MSRSSRSVLILSVWVATCGESLSFAAVAGATPNDERMPVSVVHRDAVAPLETLSRIEAPAVDLAAVAAEDLERDLADLPSRFAIPNDVFVTPATDGTWEEVEPGHLLWRLRIGSPGALSLNLGFGRYQMPPGGELFVYAADLGQIVRPFTAADNQDHGQLWTPVILADEIVVELSIPAAAVADLGLELTSVNVGYRGFGETRGLRAGSCNNDVICPEGDGWRAEIPSVGVFSTGGSLDCTGAMVNNTAQDQTPFFLTANHCGVTSGNAASLVVYWNFQSPTCGQHGGGSLNQFQSGSTFKASYSNSDFTLVQLNAAPNPAWNISYAGWDRSTADPPSAVGIHHPNCDEKSISFAYNPLTTTTYLSDTVPGDGTHLHVVWNDGVTEPGSSGSPIFDSNHHVVGQLHGGYSACGNSDMRDWYGRLSRSWTGGGTSSTRLSNWLDPGNTGAMSVDTLAPGVSGIKVTPPDALALSGPVGGGFAPAGTTYTIANQGGTSLNYQVSATVAWLSIANGSGTLAGHTQTTVTVSASAAAAALPAGTYSGSVNFVNLTDHDGDAARAATLQVGGAAWDPVAHNMNVAAAVSVQTEIELSASDPNGDALTYTLESLPALGYLSDPGAGAITTVPYVLAGGGKIVRYQPPCGQSYVEGFTFSAHDLTAGSNVATVTVTVSSAARRRVYNFPLDTNPGWTTEGAWAFGHPTGGGTHHYDPSAGYTGTNVYGYNLNGDYTNNLAATYLTTTALNCANLTNTQLRFGRWLGVERADRATVQVSNDGATWTTLWQNPTTAHVSDAAWSQQVFDLSAYADGQTTVYVRWGMGPTDGTVAFPGWNVDDVEVWGQVPPIPSDFNGDGQVTLGDFAILSECLAGPEGGLAPACLCVDLDGDGDVDLADFATFQDLLGG
jgi:lysyl endopeptidase